MKNLARTVALSLLFVFGLLAHAANAADLAKADLERLERGELVTRDVRLERIPRPRAGLSYAVVDVPPGRLARELKDGRRFVRLLPFVLEAEAVEERGLSSTYAIRQGALGISGRYHVTMKWAEDRASGRFALDPSRPHDLPELWGYFRLEPFPGDRTLVTFAVAFRLPFALRPFERRVLEAALTTPVRLRMLVP
jgi:hypothetical protein